MVKQKKISEENYSTQLSSNEYKSSDSKSSKLDACMRNDNSFVGKGENTQKIILKRNFLIKQLGKEQFIAIMHKLMADKNIEHKLKNKN